MCGIAGIFSQSVLASDSQMDMHFMVEALNHRGPNAKGIKMLDQSRLAFGHTRLSILDLSAQGLQPMQSCSKNLTITFNGEIYNHLELRQELSKEKNIQWKSSTDTETLLECIDHFGIKKTLKKLKGMFAFGLWDDRRKKLFLCRDRFGEKPLYYGWVGQKFVFSSELKAITAIKNFDNKISSQALFQYLECSFVPAPLSIYEHIYKLSSGAMLEINTKPPSTPLPIDKIDHINHQSMSIQKWWRHDQYINNTADLSQQEGQELVHQKLKDSVRSQLISDVPLGCLLSGGVDSSLIASIMQSESSQPINTFTIGFHDKDFDESLVARNSAKLLGTNHHEIISSPEDAIRIAKKMPTIFDEPFADSSQIPTFLVSELASSSVTVALSGDGGDELFGGYNRYVWGPKIFKILNAIPVRARNILLAYLKKFPQSSWENLLQFMPMKRPHEKIQKTLQAMSHASSLPMFYQSLISVSKNSNLLLDQQQSTNLLQNQLHESSHDSLHLAEQMMLNDTLIYMSDDILCKVDRSSMANSLEIRAPYLDHELYKASWELPLDHKINKGVSKQLLKNILNQYIPLKNFDNKKSGFSIPLGDWLRGPLKEWGADLIYNSVSGGNYLCMEKAKSLWLDHQSKKIDHSDKLWNLLIFLGWLENQ
jgi:asparagine synthase (glutamine-hydrolysing)